MITARILFVDMKNLHVLQMSGYSYVKMIKYNKNNNKKFTWFLLPNVLFFMLELLFDNEVVIAINESLFVLIYLAFTLEYYFSNKKDNKTPLKYTNRIIRFIVLLTMVYIVSLSVCLLSTNIDSMSVTLMFVPISMSLLFCLCFFVSCIFEYFLSNFYLVQSKIKLKKCSNLIKIAVTGSYAKTSVKYILETILSEKYCVLKTPNSYNTPNGISKTILNDLEKKHNVFIMEFGANKAGDIKSLCRKFKPDMGIITYVGNQHLENFKSINNVYKTKFELVDYLKKSNAFIVFNSEDLLVKDGGLKYSGDKVFAGINGEVSARNLSVSSSGSSFDIYNKGCFYANVKTCLLGEHNINNILLAVAMAIKLKLSKIQIIRGVSNLKPVQHRLELKTHKNGLLILDNSYNSNPNSAIESLRVLKMFSGINKVVITCGFIELGEQQYNFNYQFGVRLAGVANKVYVVNKVNREAIVNGLKSQHFNNERIVVVDEFRDIDFKKFGQGEIVLIENDLPDSYL